MERAFVNLCPRAQRPRAWVAEIKKKKELGEQKFKKQKGFCVFVPMRTETTGMAIRNFSKAVHIATLHKKKNLKSSPHTVTLLV